MATPKTGRPRGRPRKATSQGRAAANADGWQNIWANIGNRGDPVSHTSYGITTPIDRLSLASIYRGDGLGRRVVDLLPDEATREWIEADTEFLVELSRINAKQNITDALKWSRLFGGAVIVAMVDDGGDFDDPLRLGGVRAIRQLRVYDRHRVTWTSTDIDVDPQSSGFGMPAFYNVQPLHGAPYRVHASRMHRIDGMGIPDDERQRNQGWGDSALQGVHQALQHYGLTMGATANIVRDFVQTVLSINGLTDMLRNGDDKLVADRIKLLDMSRSVANLIAMDADGEQYTKQASSVAGLADLWDRFALHVCTVTGIPSTKLLGRAPVGLNSTGKGDERQWYDTVQAYRRDDIEPVMNWLVPIIEAQTEWKSRPETLDWQWPALGQPSEAEWATIKKTTADADAIYMDRGGVNPRFLFEARYGHGEFRPEADLSMRAYSEWLETADPDDGFDENDTGENDDAPDT
jgi:phage-related protein (TIGR01555 family)